MGALLSLLLEIPACTQTSAGLEISRVIARLSGRLIDCFGVVERSRFVRQHISRICVLFVASILSNLIF
jgi:hypothetical protein